MFEKHVRVPFSPRLLAVRHWSLLITGFIMVIISLLAAANATAHPAHSGNNPKRTVVKKVKLKPQAGAEVIIPNFTLTLYSDSTREVHGNGTFAPDEKVSFTFEVDPDNETYVTRRVDLASVAAPNAISPMVVVPGQYTRTLVVHTWDPAAIDLAHTINLLSWNVSSSGSVSVTTYVDDCWAANPSALGTHWAVTACQVQAAYTYNGEAINASQGSYENWDWLSYAQRTWSDHAVVLYGQNDGASRYSWYYNDGGESYHLIYGSIASY